MLKHHEFEYIFEKDGFERYSKVDPHLGIKYLVSLYDLSGGKYVVFSSKERHDGKWKTVLPDEKWQDKGKFHSGWELK